MKLNIGAFLLAASVACAQYSNGTITLQPSYSSGTDGTVIVTGDDVSTTKTITLYTTITMSGEPVEIETSYVEDAVEEVYTDDVTSTSTTTYVTTVTLVNSASEATATTVSTVEKEILLATQSCVPETVTVTEYETTKYVTVGESATSTPSSSPLQAFYSNQTATSI